LVTYSRFRAAAIWSLAVSLAFLIAVCPLAACAGPLHCNSPSRCPLTSSSNCPALDLEKGPASKAGTAPDLQPGASLNRPPVPKTAESGPSDQPGEFLANAGELYLRLRVFRI
jgi:hypothetical protein